MNQRQSTALVLNVAAELVDGDRDQGWIRDDDRGEISSPADAARIERAIKSVSAMLWYKRERLASPVKDRKSAS